LFFADVRSGRWGCRPTYTKADGGISGVTGISEIVRDTIVLCIVLSISQLGISVRITKTYSDSCFRFFFSVPTASPPTLPVAPAFVVVARFHLRVRGELGLADLAAET